MKMLDFGNCRFQNVGENLTLCSIWSNEQWIGYFKRTGTDYDRDYLTLSKTHNMRFVIISY